LASNASFYPSIAAVPHRVVSFINVVGCGTCPSNGIRQNRRQVIESATSRHNNSYPRPCRDFRNINRRYVSIGVDGRPNLGGEERPERGEEHLVVQQPIHPLELHRQPPDLLREHRLPQTDLISMSP
jgi:hypothetical protein